MDPVIESEEYAMLRMERNDLRQHFHALSVRLYIYDQRILLRCISTVNGHRQPCHVGGIVARQEDCTSRYIFSFPPITPRCHVIDRLSKLLVCIHRSRHGCLEILIDVSDWIPRHS